MNKDSCGNSTTRVGSHKQKRSEHWFDRERSTKADSKDGWFPMEDNEQKRRSGGAPQKVFAMLGRSKDEQRIDEAIEEDGTGVDLEKGASVSHGGR